jgi:hypothetical protein
MCVLLVGSAFVGRRQTVLPHLFEMSLHRLPRLLSVAPLHCVEDPLVMNLAALGTARHFKNSQALFPQQSNDRIDQRKDQRIPRRLRERQVKIKVSFDVGVGILSRPVHHGDRFAHGREIRFLGATGRERRNLRFQDGPHFGKMS